jgi:D-alanyl-D-alanine carboxypeptidase (penicillin-binding protein 5/6)
VCSKSAALSRFAAPHRDRLAQLGVTSRGVTTAARAAAMVAALALGVTTVGYSAFALLAPLPPVEAMVQPLEAVSTPAATVTVPTYGASAIGAAEGQQIFAGRNLDMVMPMASIAKVVTALVVLDEYPIAEGGPGATLTLTAADSRLPAQYSAINGSIAPAPAGATITQRQVIELMMVHSANNYAETLAVWAFGSVDAYLSAARQWLDDHGLSGIQIADTTGFSVDNRASPRDLIALARVAIHDPVVAQAASMPSVTVSGIGTFENRNLALGTSGVTGLKTGTLRAVGSNLLFSGVLAVGDSAVEIVGVVIGGPDQETLAADVGTLIDSVSDDFHSVTIGTAGSVVALYEAPWGDTAELRVAESIDDIVWGDVRSIAFTTAPALQPGFDNETTPRLIVRYGNREAQLRLQWQGVIDEPSLGWRFLQPLEQLLAG